MVEKLYIFMIMYLNDIFFYTKSKSKKHVKAIWWILKQLQKYLLYANLKNDDITSKRWDS